MFTGIITSVGTVVQAQDLGVDRRIQVRSTWEQPDLVLGESIAIDGACMTVVAFEDAAFSVEVSSESLARTTLGQLRPGAPVNLERALQVGDRLGGHFVSGHIDGVGRITSIAPSGECIAYRFFVPGDLQRYAISKGSICIDGISLTVNSIDDDCGEVEVMVVPHTQSETSLGTKAVGTPVNLEMDALGKYVERLLQGEPARP